MTGFDPKLKDLPDCVIVPSRRIISAATRLRDGICGRAGGTKLRYPILADCHAIRRNLTGKYEGYGAFGIFDETSVWKQILLQAGQGVMSCGSYHLDDRQATRRFHAHRASLRARRLNNHPPPDERGIACLLSSLTKEKTHEFHPIPHRPLRRAETLQDRLH